MCACLSFFYFSDLSCHICDRTYKQKSKLLRHFASLARKSLAAIVDHHDDDATDPYEESHDNDFDQSPEKRRRIDCADDTVTLNSVGNESYVKASCSYHAGVDETSHIKCIIIVKSVT